MSAIQDDILIRALFKSITDIGDDCRAKLPESLSTCLATVLAAKVQVDCLADAVSSIVAEIDCKGCREDVAQHFEQLLSIGLDRAMKRPSEECYVHERKRLSEGKSRP
jgi:hypothetical protein